MGATGDAGRTKEGMKKRLAFAWVGHPNTEIPAQKAGPE
jgi:hypothetical protein